MLRMTTSCCPNASAARVEARATCAGWPGQMFLQHTVSAYFDVAFSSLTTFGLYASTQMHSHVLPSFPHTPPFPSPSSAVVLSTVASTLSVISSLTPFIQTTATIAKTTKGITLAQALL